MPHCRPLAVGNLIRQSEAWKAERERAEREANQGRAVAAERQENRGNQHTAKKVEVVPQIVAPPTEPKRDYKATNERRATTALAAQIGTNRGAVERAQT